MNEVLTINNISKTYKKKSEILPILKDASFTLMRGEMVALVGPSGSGKSTFLQIAGLLDSLDSGTIEISGVDQTNINERQKTRFRNQNIGFVYQFHHLLAEFTALENVMIPQFPLGISKPVAIARALSLLQSVGLENRINHKPSELSGGEQQRVAICRALANRPMLLLADEPTGNLDPKTSSAIFELLYNIVKNENLSTIIATHNLDLAQKMDRVITLNDGRIYEL